MDDYVVEDEHGRHDESPAELESIIMAASSPL